MRQLWEHCEAGARCSPASMPREPAWLQPAKRGWGLAPNVQAGLLEHGRALLAQKSLRFRGPSTCPVPRGSVRRMTTFKIIQIG